MVPTCNAVITTSLCGHESAQAVDTNATAEPCSKRITFWRVGHREIIIQSCRNAHRLMLRVYWWHGIVPRSKGCLDARLSRQRAT